MKGYNYELTIIITNELISFLLSQLIDKLSIQ